MKKMTQKLYAVAAELHLLERGNPEDPFHLIVYRITGKEHVSELNQKEENAVLTELLAYQTNSDYSGSKIRNQEAVLNMMSPAQQSFAWRLMYQIQSYDLHPNHKTIGERLAGVVKKELDITASGTEPLKWVNKKNGNILIEALKRYATSAERKYIRQQSKKSK